MDTTTINPVTPPSQNTTPGPLGSPESKHDHTPSSEMAGPPPTPVHDSGSSAVKVETYSPPPTSYATLLLHLQQSGSGSGESIVTRQYLKRPLSEAERRIPDWLLASQGAGADEIQQDAAPPPAPPLSPTAGAPFIHQSQRLKRRRDETYASQEFLAHSRKPTADDGSDFADDHDDGGGYGDELKLGNGAHYPIQLCSPSPSRRALTDVPAIDDNISDLENLDSPFTAHEAPYCSSPVVIDCSRGFSVTSYKELEEVTSHPEYLAEQLQADVAQLRQAAQGMDEMLKKIYQLESDVIIVVEMAKKLERRVGYMEKSVEDSLPKDEDGVDSVSVKTLNDRIMALESLLLPLTTELSEQSLQDTTQPDLADASFQNQVDPDSVVEGLAELHAKMGAQPMLANPPLADSYNAAV